ncbi:MAG: serine/threonine-protein phosphatase [Chloroflexi bacterium]|nr:serine/threonine-protein phosphatase [Chloroflexota bacterium]
MTIEWSPSTASHAARTDVGVVRDHNEDRFLARPPLFMVADGLGGQAAGEIAAELLVDTLQRLPAEPTATELIAAIESANRAIRDAAAAGEALRGMSTTCVAILMLDVAAEVVHVGDSRAYRLRAGRLERLTEDHSVVAELVRGGIIDASEAETDDRRHILTQALGSANRIAISASTIDVQAGDRFLLCSDGLSGQVDDRDIEAVMRGDGDPGVAADELVRRSNAAGGHDNVTVIVVDAQMSIAPRVRDQRSVHRPIRGQRTSVAVALLAAFLLAAVVGLALGNGWFSTSRTAAPGASVQPAASPTAAPTGSSIFPATSGSPGQVPGASGGDVGGAAGSAEP